MPRGKKNSVSKATTKKTTKKKTITKKAPKKATKKKTTKKVIKKKAGRPKGSKNKSKKVVVEKIQEKELIEEATPKKKKSILTNELPERWILSQGMHFGLINQGFAVGTIFTVDWANNKMRCESNGIIYDNIKDLEIGKRLGTVVEYVENEESLVEQQEIEIRAQQAKLEALQNSRKQRDKNVRDMIDHSDRDVVRDIDISHTHKDKKINDTPIKKTASSEVSIMKPQIHNEMEVHYSDGTQDGITVRSSNSSPLRPRVGNSSSNAKPLSPVLSGTKIWDATKGGEIENDIRKKMSDYSIKIDENGQQYIRGLPVIRDDSEASGPSRNEGMVVSMTKEQLADRSHKIQQIRVSKKQEVAQNRAKSGQTVEDNSIVDNPIDARGPEMDVSSMVPQDLIPGMGISDQGVEQIESTPIPIEEVRTAKKKKKSGFARKLLRRRK